MPRRELAQSATNAGYSALDAMSRFVAKTKHGNQIPANERHHNVIPLDDRQVALVSSARPGHHRMDGF
jgi:hypothetical protein